jgi:hypothetical protein
MSGYTTPPRQLDPNAPLHFRVDHYDSGVPIMKSNKFIPLSDHDHKQIVKVPVEGVPEAFVLLNFFTAAECQALISIGESMEFQPAKVSTSGGSMHTMTNVRNNERVVWQCNEEWLEILRQRYLPFLPTNENQYFPKGYDSESCGLNNRLRIFKYTKGQRFVPHFDAGFNKSDSVRSWMTFIAYLQAPAPGCGHTVFFHSGTDQPITSVEPQAGSALFFYHQEHPLSPLHSGQLVTSGTKYALRSDVMFQKTKTTSVNTKATSEGDEKEDDNCGKKKV